MGPSTRPCDYARWSHGRSEKRSVVQNLSPWLCLWLSWVQVRGASLIHFSSLVTNSPQSCLGVYIFVLWSLEPHLRTNTMTLTKFTPSPRPHLYHSHLSHPQIHHARISTVPTPTTDLQHQIYTFSSPAAPHLTPSPHPQQHNHTYITLTPPHPHLPVQARVQQCHNTLKNQSLNVFYKSLGVSYSKKYFLLSFRLDVYIYPRP